MGSLGCQPLWWAHPAGQRMFEVERFCLHLPGLFSRTPGQVVMSMVACSSYPTGCLEPSERGRLMSRSWFCGASLTAGKLRSLWFLTPAPTVKVLLPSPPPIPSWEDGICFPVTHVLSLWVEGGERGCVGSRVGGCGGGGWGKVTHFTLASSSGSSLVTSLEQLSPAGRCVRRPHWSWGQDCPGSLRRKLRLVPGLRSMVKGS